MQGNDKILPWKNDELEKLLLGLIAHGTETLKADFKSEIEIGTNEQKADLLKDIITIANTYDENDYEDHGFLIYGVAGKTIGGISRTEANTDKLQATIEQLLKDYISPMPQIYVIGFETATGQKWGVVVIPPRNNKPYMFSKDLQCGADARRSRKRGEWFVRRGTTTDVGLPEDLARITQKQTDLLLAPLRESISSLQVRIAKTEEQYNSALFKVVKRALSATTKTAAKSSKKQEEVADAEIEEVIGVDLPARLKQKLQTPQDVLAEDLVLEAKLLHDFLYGSNTGLPWAPQLGKPEENKKIIETLEEKTRKLQLSIATIVLNDRKGEYTKALFRALKVLARSIEVPPGTPYNSAGTALRYYPLGLILYTIFTCGTVADRGDLLKETLAIPLVFPNKNNGKAPISHVLYFWYEARALFNDAFGQRWCEPIAVRIRQVITDRIMEMLTDTAEPDLFFRGEFMLVLSGIAIRTRKGEDAESRVPLPGLYLYLDVAETAVVGLLNEHPAWLDKVYSQPMNELLDSFDKNAYKVTSAGCIASSFRGAKMAEVYQSSTKAKGVD